VVIHLEQGANDFHMVQLMPMPPNHFWFIKIQNDLTFLVSAYPGCPGKEAVKWVAVMKGEFSIYCFFSEIAFYQLFLQV